MQKRILKNIFLVCMSLISLDGVAEIIQCHKKGKLIFTDNPADCARDVKVISVKPVNTFVEAKKRVVANVSFDDPHGGIHNKEKLANSVKAAWAEWSKHIHGAGSMEIHIQFVEHNGGRLSASSPAAVRVASVGKYTYFNQGAAEELTSGHDPNGEAPDILIRGDLPAFARLWFDQNPTRRYGRVDSNKIDATSVFAHEIGHALCFNGFLDLKTQRSTRNNQLSMFDKWVVFDGAKPRYIGPSLVAVYGSSIPLFQEAGFYMHFDMEGSSARPIMAEQSIKLGERYFVTEIDLAVIKDCGIPLKLK